VVWDVAFGPEAMKNSFLIHFTSSLEDKKKFFDSFAECQKEMKAEALGLLMPSGDDAEEDE
jgi:hypothetical protein